jgi:hypothetical protein
MRQPRRPRGSSAPSTEQPTSDGEDDLRRKVMLKRARDRSQAKDNTELPRGSGDELPRDVRARMEPRVGADLGKVRVHTGADSARAADELGARAFTVDDQVHFNRGEFAPGTKEGDG